MRAHFFAAANNEANVILERTQSAIALLAAGGLLALTISAAMRASTQTQLSEAVMMIVAWVAVLASALLGKQRSMASEPAPTAQESPAVPAVAAAAPVQPTPQTPSRSTPSRPRPESSEAPRQDEPWFEPLLEFAQQTLGALHGDRLRQLVAQQLPALVGREDVWVVANIGEHQQVILPAREEGEQPRTILGDEPGQWATFPLKADGHTVGVLGIDVVDRGITAREWRMLTAVSGVLARALKTSEAFEAMREATLVDPLTGCATRGEGMRRFEAELRRAERSKTSLGVLMIDLDHFKSINDRYGHNTGDAVLSAVGETLLSTLRASDIRSRWGGEEFLVVLPESTIERARSAAESLRQRIANTTVRDGAHTVHVTTSVGITITRPGETDIPRLLGRADAALYQAKSEGRNRIVVALGDNKGTVNAGVPAGEPPPASQRTAQERRDTGQRDRRTSFGRRRTDAIAGPWPGTS
jgi:diguanylate cyclase (GGDEF)-like protein